jgi:hypothetical protein
MALPMAENLFTLPYKINIKDKSPLIKVIRFYWLKMLVTWLFLNNKKNKNIQQE